MTHDEAVKRSREFYHAFNPILFQHIGDKERLIKALIPALQQAYREGETPKFK